ncbi:unnamed protein product [Aureobasidium mustum]|uniref:Flavin reductase like domain-containing protein n=1 Tax=Aureobasidium mustum TaxID=2773714 RepID=A0A9N8P8Y6_9PEZI|nr:unnamed protein product [Aureobasidium mustum]
MPAAVRGPATGRFYRAFHAWSSINNVSHQQQRCFVPTASLYETDDAGSQVWKYKAKEDGKHVIHVAMPQARFERMQQHPTYFQRMHAGVNATLEPQGAPTPDGSRIIRVEAPNSKTCAYVRQLLRRHADDQQALDNTVFKMDRRALKNRTIDLKIEVSHDRAGLLEDNANELELRIEEKFSVQLNFVPSLEPVDGIRTIAIIGRHPNVNAAKDFINSLQNDLEQSIQIEEQKSDKSLGTSPEPSSVGLKPEDKPATIKDMYKSTMRSVPSSVVVLTTKTSSSASDIDSLRGMTVSSLTSVTLEPEPIVSFSIRGPSRTLDCITAGQPFTVNFLSAHSVGAQIADIFSKPHDHPSQPFHAVRALQLVTKTFGLGNGSGPPCLGGKNVPARFTCELLPGKSLEIGDHTVIFARVTDVWRSQKYLDSQRNLPTFLTYAQAGYRTLDPLPIKSRKSKALKPDQTGKSALSTSEAPISQLPQTEVKPQETQAFDEDVSAEITKPDITDDVVDAYWRMALDEGEEDSVLEERAADQRALGEAQRPADHPAADVEDDFLYDPLSPKKQEK